MLQAMQAAPRRKPANTRGDDTTMETFTLVDIAAGREHSLALMANGDAWGWGAEGSGRVSMPAVCSTAPPATPIIVPATRPFQRVAAGYGASYGITNDHQGYVWGVSRGGLAGTTNTLATLQAEPMTGLGAVEQIAAGEFFGLARDAEGSLFLWGLSRGGPAGLRNHPPHRVDLSAAVRDVTVSTSHVLALTEQGLYAWGSNAAGQLGLGHLQDQRLPQIVPLPPEAHTLKQAAAGTTHTLALTTEGNVWAWGANQHGQLGSRNVTHSATPIPVRLPEPATRVVAGMFYSAALGASGTVYTWGWNGKGQLGRSTEPNDAEPGAVPDLDAVTQIAAGQGHMLAAHAHKLYAWGDNAASQLGPQGPQAQGPTQPGWSPYPVLVLA